MRKLGLLLAPAVIAAAVAACGPAEQNDDKNGDKNQNDDVIEVSSDIESPTRWEAGKTYLLKQHTFVRGATLTIEEGVTVLGGEGTSLVVTPTGRIDAVGTAQKPVVFTSALEEGERAPGDWGGVVLVGRAPINVNGGTNTIEGFTITDANRADLTYGGTDAAHDCGTLKYVRIEYAGYELTKDKELNALTVAGCGTGTTLEYIQTHKGSDDGVEMFGGTADLKYVLITQPGDDGLDWDLGWTGRAQFVVVQQSPTIGNNAFESDSNKNNLTAEPRSNPTLYNVTLIGSGIEPGTLGEAQRAMHLRHGTAGVMANVIVAHFADGAIDVGEQFKSGDTMVDDTSAALAQSGELVVKNSIFFDIAGSTSLDNMPADKETAFDELAWLAADPSANRHSDPMLEDAMNLDAPNFLPKAGSPALSAAATPPADGFFDTSATFVGAFKDIDWTAGWTAYPNE